MGLDFSGKGFFSSKTVWGGLIALVPLADSLLAQFGILPTGTINEATAAIVSAAGALLAIWGRVKATKSITKIV